MRLRARDFKYLVSHQFHHPGKNPNNPSAAQSIRVVEAKQFSASYSGRLPAANWLTADVEAPIRILRNYRARDERERFSHFSSLLCTDLDEDA